MGPAGETEPSQLSPPKSSASAAMNAQAFTVQVLQLLFRVCGLRMRAHSHGGSTFRGLQRGSSALLRKLLYLCAMPAFPLAASRSSLLPLQHHPCCNLCHLQGSPDLSNNFLGDLRASFKRRGWGYGLCFWQTGKQNSGCQSI